ncbi:hypothetical protein HNQ80_004423 [Anaerosolibacter carboniphilus]|uniref:DUF6873 domain-containing protein n=1 Tax=Anaerosolibacter carboniphilus TaxID=1417629 RepID=A0A841KXA9_9FIRM|nr:hypothetical protein [Anaerosolibacter carboniphilus]MBB6218264.1 hypothetical protein [Anaerosolibacter carboniphilus]
MKNSIYLEIPFIPKKTVTTMIIDGRAPAIVSNSLEKMGIHILKAPCCEELYPAISYHPDILLHPVNERDIVIAPNVYNELAPVITQLGLHAIRGNTNLKSNYPHNIAYNVARLSNFAIHCFKYTDPILLELLQQQGVEFIDVKQGYSKCSICIVNERAIITADHGIAKAVKKHGIETLLISPGYISLTGLSYGFIGGASGLLGKDQIAFSGKLTHHPDYGRIINFLDEQQMNPIFLSDDEAIDIGSMIPILQMAA